MCHKLSEISTILHGMTKFQQPLPLPFFFSVDFKYGEILSKMKTILHGMTKYQIPIPNFPFKTKQSAAGQMQCK